MYGIMVVIFVQNLHTLFYSVILCISTEVKVSSVFLLLLLHVFFLKLKSNQAVRLIILFQLKIQQKSQEYR